MYCRRIAAKLLSGANLAEFLMVHVCSKLSTSSKERTEMDDSLFDELTRSLARLPWGRQAIKTAAATGR
jgi:hypothetical protein